VIGRGRENGAAVAPFEPEVRVKPVSGARTWRSRSTLLLLILSVLLIAAISVVLILNIAAPQSPKVQGTPVAPGDILKGDESDWPDGPTFFFDSAGHYHIVNKFVGQAVAIGLYENHQYSNFQLQVTMSQRAGPVAYGDFYGVVLRSDEFQSHYYLFEICPYTGQYLFDRFDNGHWDYRGGSVPSMHSAAGQSNTLKAVVRGNSFTLFVNGMPVQAAFKDTFPSPLTIGEVGLSVELNNVEVVFSDMTITRLS
jgi:hypothetical protein